MVRVWLLQICRSYGAWDIGAAVTINMALLWSCGDRAFWDGFMSMKNIDFRLERDLNFRIGGEHSTGKLFVGDLVWQEDKKRWACHWSLAYVHPEIGRIYGLDPLAALTNTLDFLSSLIRGSEDDGLIVWWQKEGDHAGLVFPQCEGQKWKEMPPLK
jgi:hypothetical protein